MPSSPPLLLPPVESRTLSSPPICPLLLILLLSSLSPSPCYSCCHPHRTSQKCADSGCWATLPYYRSFKWKPSRVACDWRAVGRGGAAAMLYDHMGIYTCFVHINKSLKCSQILSVSSRGKDILLYLTHQGQTQKTQLYLGCLSICSLMVNKMIHLLN